MSHIRKLVLSSLTLAVLGLSAGLAKADTVFIGGTNGSSCYPFGNCGYMGRYQQFYSSSQFSGPMLITQIAFSSGSPNAADFNQAGPATYNFTLSLSNTSATPSSFSASY